MLDMFKPIENFTSRQRIESSAKWFIGLISILLILGLVMVYSARTVKTARLGGDPMTPLFEHAIKVAIGIFGMLVMMKIDYRSLSRHYGKIWLLAVLALILVLIPSLGVEVNGARRWFRFMGFMIQPSEFAKPALIIVLASLMVRAGNSIQNLTQGFLPPLIAIAVICSLILRGPDFGTTVITGGLGVTLLVIGGVRIGNFLLLTSVMAPLLFLYAFSSMEHVSKRVTNFLVHVEGSQIHHSLVAIASGGFIGTGLGASIWKLNFIPECDSDFIFAIIGEELGFFGTSLVICLFAAVLYHGVIIIRGVKNRLGFYLATGIVLLITTQALVNMVVVVGMAPTKGLPLPFISSGGSSLIALMMCVGLFLNIAKNPEATSEPVRDEFCESWLEKIAASVQKTSSGGRR